MENSVEILQKFKNINTMWSNNSTLGYISKQNKNLKIYICIYPNIHCSIIYYSQAMEVIKVSINTWVDKEDMVCVCGRLLFNHEKECNGAICDDSDGHREYYDK